MTIRANSSAAAPRKPRLGYCLRMYPRFSQTFIVNEILELERQGHQLRVASLRKPGDGVFHDSICRVRAKVDYLPDVSNGRAPVSSGNGAPPPARTAATYARAIRERVREPAATWEELLQAGLLIQWARKRKIDHVHVHFGTSEATVAWLATHVAGPSYSLTLHAFDIFRDTVDRRLLTRKINGSRFTVTVCESNREFLLSKMPGIDPNRVRVNYNGIDLDRFQDRGRARPPRTILAVGRLIEKKGFIHLIQAVARLRHVGIHVRCEIAGDGREKPALQRRIEQLALSDHVRLVGLLPQDQIQERLQQSALFVLPCVQARDGNVDALPTVLLEALASGCPAISTRISGVPEIIEDGVSGLLVEPQDEDGLATAIARVVEEPRLASALAAGGRKRAESRFDVRRNVRTFANWLAADTVDTPESQVLVAPAAAPAVSPFVGAR